MKEANVICKRGNARVRVSSKGWTQVLTGKRRKWDTLHWSFFSDTSEMAIQGLWRGRYADAIATTENLLTALREIGATSAVSGIEEAMGRQ